MEYALIDENNEIIDTGVNIDPDVPTKSGYRWIRIETRNPPKYNPVTQSISLKTEIVDDVLIKYWDIDVLSYTDRMARINNEFSNVPVVILFALMELYNYTHNTEYSLEEYKGILAKSYDNYTNN